MLLVCGQCKSQLRSKECLSVQVGEEGLALEGWRRCTEGLLCIHGVAVPRGPRRLRSHIVVQSYRIVRGTTAVFFRLPAVRAALQS